jgi:hypothetical protein
LFDAEITSFSSSPPHGESYQGRPNQNPRKSLTGRKLRQIVISIMIKRSADDKSYDKLLLRYPYRQFWVELELWQIPAYPLIMNTPISSQRSPT